MASNHNLKSLQRLDCLLIETNDQQLPPVPNFSRIPLDLVDHILRGLGCKIHTNEAGTMRKDSDKSKTHHNRALFKLKSYESF